MAPTRALDLKVGSERGALGIRRARTSPRTRQARAPRERRACDAGYAVSPARLALLWRYSHAWKQSPSSDRKKSHDNFERSRAHDDRDRVSRRTPGIRITRGSHGARRSTLRNRVYRGKREGTRESEAALAQAFAAGELGAQRSSEREAGADERENQRIRSAEPQRFGGPASSAGSDACATSVFSRRFLHASQKLWQTWDMEK